MLSMINSTSCQSTLSSTSPWHTADRIDFLLLGHLLMLLVSSAQLPSLSQISQFSAHNNRALPRSSSTSNNSSSSSSRPSSKPLQSLGKTRFERGANEVRTRSEIKFWKTDLLSLLTNSLVATRFRILQEFSAVEQKRKPSQAACCRQEQGERRGDKGRVRETEGRQRDTSLANQVVVTNLSGHRLFET